MVGLTTSSVVFPQSPTPSRYGPRQSVLALKGDYEAVVEGARRVIEAYYRMRTCLRQP